MIIHGDPELTAIAARLAVVLEYVAQRHPARYAPRLTLGLYPVRSAALGRIASIACSSWSLLQPGAGVFTPEADCMWRYVRNGTDYADLCTNGLVEFSMHLQSTEAE